MLDAQNEIATNARAPAARIPTSCSLCAVMIGMKTRRFLTHCRTRTASTIVLSFRGEGGKTSARFPSRRRPISIAGGEFTAIARRAFFQGPQYLRALKVPLPQIPLIATGGVNQQTASDFILAGATAIGVGENEVGRCLLI